MSEAEQKSDFYFVCLYAKDEKIVGYAVSGKNDFSLSIDTPKPVSDAEDDQTPRRFESIFKNFSESMFAYIDFLPVIAAFAPSMGQLFRNDVFHRLFEDKCIEKSIEGNNTIYKLPVDTYERFLELRDIGENFLLMTVQVPKMLIIGCVSSLEYYLTLLIREIFLSNVGMIEGSDKPVSIKDVFVSGDLSEFKAIIIDKEVESIMRESFSDQIKWFEQTLRLGRSIREDYPDWDALIEIIERRNIFAHSNGIVGKRYLDKVKKLNIDGFAVPKRGAELIADGKYLDKSLENLIEFGVKIIWLVWGKINKDEIGMASLSVSDFAFTLIEKGEYRLAARLYEFAKTFEKTLDARQRLMNVVNYANASALAGNVRQRDVILSDHDWNSMSDDFAICVAAIRGEVEKVVKLMKKLVHDEEWRARFYEEWPVFFHVRNAPAFIESFSEAYGRAYVPSAKKKKTIVELLGSLQKVRADRGDAREKRKGVERSSKETLQ